METHESEVKWVNGLKFDAVQNGHTFRIDGTHEPGAPTTGVRPKALILSSLAGCTGIDIVEMLQKMRVPFSDFSMKVIGNLTESSPKTYHTVTLVYSIKLAHEEDRAKMERAVHLSQDRYCGVGAMIKKFADLKVEIRYL